MTKIKCKAEVLHKAFPPVALDVNRPVNTGSISWTRENTRVLLQIWVDRVKKAGHTMDAGTFTNVGWNIGANLFNQHYDFCGKRNWDKKNLIMKLKTRLSLLVSGCP